MKPASLTSDEAFVRRIYLDLVGVTPPSAEWGLMLNTLRQSIYVNAIVPALPGIAIFITSMAFNLVSDGLRDAMDPYS